MAKKKTFMNAEALEVLVQPEETEETEAERVLAYKEALNTQGKPGMKADRINMAFTPSNMEYIRIFSKVRGQTMTQFVNDVIAESREAHKERLDLIMKLMPDLKGGKE